MGCMAQDDLIHVASAARAYQESQRTGLPIFRPQIGAYFSFLPTPLVIQLGLFINWGLFFFSVLVSLVSLARIFFALPLTLPGAGQSGLRLVMYRVEVYLL